MVRSIPCAGAPGERTNTILRYVDRKDRKLFRGFLQGVKTLPLLVGEKGQRGRCNPRRTGAKEGMVFLSRFRDNIYATYITITPVVVYIFAF